jgi:hypothetical protein
MSSRMARLVFSLLPARTGDFGTACVADVPATVPAAAPPLLSQPRQRLLSDEALVEHLQSGRADALTVLFERHSPLLFAIARRILRNGAEAEDAVPVQRRPCPTAHRPIHSGMVFDSGHRRSAPNMTDRV